MPTGRAFKWDSVNGYVDLGDLGGPHAGAYDINDSGVITGFSSSDYVTDPLNVQRNHGFRYEDGSMTDMGIVTPGTDGYSRGHSINEAGDIAGRASLTTFVGGEKHLAVWDADNNLTSVPGGGSSIYSTGQHINNHGVIVGNGINGAGDWLGMVWDESNNFAYWIDTFGGDASRAWSVNDDGTIVGFATDATGTRLAMVSLDGGATSIDLNSLVLDLTGWQYLTEAYDINESGQIVGVGVRDDGSYEAFVATVVPVPAAVWLFGSALLGLGWIRRKRV